MAQLVKNVCNAGDTGDSSFVPGLGRSPGGGNGNPLHSILAWKISCTEEPGGLQSKGSQRVRHDCATNTFSQSILQNRLANRNKIIIS